MRIILLGAPGSGKGTQGDLIAQKYRFPKISSGDLLRKAVKDRTPLGVKAEALMKRGELVSDEIVTGMIKERIEQPDCSQGYTLDGFPRTLRQALTIEEISPEKVEIAIEICLDDSVVIARLTARRICSGCGAIYNISVQPPVQESICDDCGGELIIRDDDRPEVIQDRLKVFHDQRDVLVDHYKKKSVYFRVDGGAEIAVIFKHICALLDKKIAQTGKAEAVQ